jgi:hypothetical protein
LQRWIKFGPSHSAATEASYSNASLDESQLEMSHTEHDNVLSGNGRDNEPTERAVDDSGRSKLKSELQVDSSRAGSRSASTEHFIQQRTNGSIQMTEADKQRQLPVVSQGQ